jgi:endonuclease-8
MPEGDTILHVAERMRPVLEGRVPDAIEAPQRRHLRNRWPERLAGRAVTSVQTHGKHLFLRFEGGLALHSHLGMTGWWGVYPHGRRWRRSPRRAWLVIRTAEHEVVQFDGPVRELMTEGRTRFDQRLAGLGPDIVADDFSESRFLTRLREDDQTRGLGDALLDQRNLAGMGNVWKSEGCFLARIDPWRPLRELTDDEALAIVRAVRPLMRQSAAGAGHLPEPSVYERAGRPCPRCGELVRARGQGDDNRTTFWCPGCQR